MAALRRDFTGYLLEAAKTGDVVELNPAPTVRITLVNHPELVEEVLVRQADKVRKSQSTGRMIRKFLGDGLILSEGEVYRKQRARVQPSFRPARLAELEQPIRDAARAIDPGTLDVEPAMTALALRVIARLLFGQAHADPAIANAMDRFATSIARRFRSIPLPDWVPTRRNREERQAIAVLDQAIASAPDAGVAAELAAAGASPRELRDQIATLYFAGHETSAKWLTWTLLLLADHPDVQEEAATDADLLDRVLSESLRLYPPTWLFDRQTTEPVQLGDYELTEGTTLYISPWVSHRDPRFFEDPGRFDPSRFEGEPPPRGAYYPFGFGPRNCIGRGLAELTARVALSELLGRWRFERATDEPVVPMASATLRPAAPVYLRLSPRKEP